MKNAHRKTLLLICISAGLALPVAAADRMRAGQWAGVTTLTATGRTIPNSTCMSQGDVDAMNGDAKTIRTYLEKTIPPTICKLTDIKPNGAQVIYTAACGGAPPNVVTTVYRGDSFQATSSSGANTEAKWVGACR